MFHVIKLPLKYFYMIVALLIIIMLLFLQNNIKQSRLLPVQALLPLNGLVIAIDPGHGGYDPGSSGNGLLEKDVVLQISLYLREYLQQGGARVVMTREQDKDFLETAAGPKKRLDLQNRLQVVESGGADLLVSVHANYIASPRWYGSQVFYQEGCSEGRKLAESIQRELARVLENTERQAQSSSYYILRESSMPGVMVEAGFLSNPREAALLGDSAYQRKLAWAVYLGIIASL